MTLSKLSLASPQEAANSLVSLKQDLLLNCFTTPWNNQKVKPPKYIIMTGSSVLYMLGLIERAPTDIDVLLFVEKGLKESTLFSVINSFFESNYKNIKFTSRPNFANITVFFTNKDGIDLTIDFIIYEIDDDNLPPMLKLGETLLISPVKHIFATKKILNVRKYYQDLGDITSTVSKYGL